MTIITKPISEKKLDGKLEGALLDNEGHIHIDGQGDVESQHSMDSDSVIIQNHHRKIESSTLVCMLLVSICILSVGIIGGSYMYQQYNLTYNHRRFKGWCNIPLEAQQLQQDEPNIDRSVNYYPMSVDSAVEESQQRVHAQLNDFFKEFFEIDLDQEQYENIDVPNFDGGRRGRFIHDFYANKTGIIDLDNQRCFVMPLNRDMVLQPRSLFDLIQKMWHGYYEVDTERVRETMRVVTPPVTDLADMGSYIQTECKNMSVYQLEKYNPKVVKRSIPAVEGDKFVMFAGKKTVEIDINYVEM